MSKGVNFQKFVENGTSVYFVIPYPLPRASKKKKKLKAIARSLDLHPGLSQVGMVGHRYLGPFFFFCHLPGTVSEELAQEHSSQDTPGGPPV